MKFKWRPSFYRGRTTQLLKFYLIEWVAPKVNLRELALLRYIQVKTERESAQYFGRSKTAIHELLERMLKNRNFDLSGGFDRPVT